MHYLCFAFHLYCHGNQQAPRVCPFQTANYTILMDRVGTNETITIGPTPYYYRPSSTIEIWVNSSLVVNEEYSITAVFSSLAGSVSLPNVTVCKFTATICQCIIHHCVSHLLSLLSLLKNISLTLTVQYVSSTHYVFNTILKFLYREASKINGSVPTFSGRI